MTEPLRPAELASASTSPSFHGANALNYRAPAEAAALTLGREVAFDAVAVQPGGCVVHAQDCWHGSAPNVSMERHRRALVVHFLRGDARFIDGHSLQVSGCALRMLFVLQIVSCRVPIKVACCLPGT